MVKTSNLQHFMLRQPCNLLFVTREGGRTMDLSKPLENGVYTTGQTLVNTAHLPSTSPFPARRQAFCLDSTQPETLTRHYSTLLHGKPWYRLAALSSSSQLP